MQSMLELSSCKYLNTDFFLLTFDDNSDTILTFKTNFACTLQIIWPLQNITFNNEIYTLIRSKFCTIHRNTNKIEANNSNIWKCLYPVLKAKPSHNVRMYCTECTAPKLFKENKRNTPRTEEAESCVKKH